MAYGAYLMQLWNEYEGRTIEGTYTLGKLLRSEGRNGFFATSDTTGNAAVIRLTEAHYDEDELLKRWGQVADMHQANLIGIERFGQTDFDGVAITYALMEADDANLDDVLRERPLTLAETMQVARAVHGALSALHASGLIHEHIEPANVLAVGEAVKLRSDCVRECIADIEFNTPEGCAELRRKDVHNFGMLLLECLTLEKRYNPGLNLPDIFRRMIPRMLDGTWSLEQVGQLVNPPAPARKPSTAAASPTQAATTKQQSESAKSTNGSSAQPKQTTLPLDMPRAGGGSAKDPALPNRRGVPDQSSRFNLRPWILGGVAAVVVCVIVIWHFVSPKPGQPAQASATVQSAPAVSAPAPQTESQPALQPVTAPAAGATNSAPALMPHTPGWYVIAWTYNHQSQAQTKANSINARNRGFHAEVFSPHGGVPYLVSLGGPMSESDAKALQQRARRSGLPRDTYIRNYR
jgi:eukaryotic-like serine/threonine-protein kinase